MIAFEVEKQQGAGELRLAQEAKQALFKRQELGFWQLANRDENWLVAAAGAKRLQEKFKKLFVIGLGGSALGGRCLVKTLQTDFNKNVEFVFNTDPFEVQSIFSDKTIFQSAHFLFISKSGNTLEVASLLQIVLAELKKINRPIHEAISVITEERSNALYNWAVENKCYILPHPQDVGGRFSVFSPVGLVPAAFVGLNLQNLRAGVQAALKSPLSEQIAAYYWQRLQNKETISHFWLYCTQLRSFGDWLTQLWAESLAKTQSRNNSPAPTASVPVFYSGTCDQHSVLQQLMQTQIQKSVCFVRNLELSAMGPKIETNPLKFLPELSGMNLGEVYGVQSASTQEALNEVGVSTSALNIESVNEKSLGELLMTFQLVIGILGELMNINAFDQPGVELGKKITQQKIKNR